MILNSICRETDAVRGHILLSFDYPPHDGGIARLCAQLVKGLSNQGVPIDVLTVAGLGVDGTQVPAVPEWRVTSRRPWCELAILRRLRRRRGTGTLLCDLWYPAGALGVLAGFRPLVILAHGAELRFSPRDPRKPLWAWLRRFVLEHADLVIANSTYTSGLVRSAAPNARVASVRLSVDHERFSPGDRAKARRRFRIPEEKRVILSVSRLWRYKGHDVVLRALSHLSDEIQERFIYVIAGKGPDEESLRHEANRLNLDSVVRWLGYVPEDDLPDLYRCADLFVLCTRDSSVDGRIEGFGLVFLEAQACGVPVVGTRSGGIPDAVEEDEGGWLIAQDADNELADILQLLASDPLAFAQMGRKGRSRVEREMTLDGYITRMRSVLSSHGIACY